MKKCEIHQLYNLEETIAADIFKNVTYPWEVLPKIKDFIVELGNTLDASVYEKRGENIWVAKSAKVADTDRKSTRLNSSHREKSRMPSSA